MRPHTVRTCAPAALALLLLLVPPPALAGKPSSADEAADGHGEKRREVMERIRMMRMYALTEALELDEATAAKLFPYLRDQDREITRLREARRGQRHALRKMVNDGAYDARELDRLTATLFDLDIKLAEARRDQVAGLENILSVEQRAKFVLVSARFEEKVHGMIKEERRRRRERRERWEHRGSGGDGRHRDGDFDPP